MSKKIPLRQSEIQPTFKGFLETFKNKSNANSSTPKSSDIYLQLNEDTETFNNYESCNIENLEINPKMSIITIFSGFSMS